jgi:hypothetical protein
MPLARMSSADRQLWDKTTRLLASRKDFGKVDRLHWSEAHGEDDTKNEMKAMLAELLGTLPDFVYSAAVAATLASATDIPRSEPMRILRRPTMS